MRLIYLFSLSLLGHTFSTRGGFPSRDSEPNSGRQADFAANSISLTYKCFQRSIRRYPQARLW